MTKRPPHLHCHPQVDQRPLVDGRVLLGTRQPLLHWALEAVVMVGAGTGTAAVVTWWWGSEVSCRAPPPALDTRLTGLEVSRDRLWGFRKRGAVTRLGVLPAVALAKRKFPLPSREVMGRVPLDARALHTPWMVARVLLLIRAGLRALPSPPGARLNRAPPGLNWDDAISPGFRPAAVAMAAKLAPAGSWVAPCSAAVSPGDATIT